VSAVALSESTCQCSVLSWFLAAARYYRYDKLLFDMLMEKGLSILEAHRLRRDLFLLPSHRLHVVVCIVTMIVSSLTAAHQM